jgi:hypothetical protein
MNTPTLEAMKLGTLRRYRYECQGAHAAGVLLHPQVAIQLLAPRATELRPESIAACWMFTSPPIEAPPAYVVDITTAYIDILRQFPDE